MQFLRIPLLCLSLAGLLLSLWVHVQALQGVDVSQGRPQVWALHVGVFIVFFPMVMFSRRLLGRKPTLRQMRSLMPGWVSLLCAGVIAYAFVNFLVGMSTLQDGSPAMRDGQYVLENKGHVKRVITADEFHAGQATNLRLFSGHWIAFYFIPFAFFAFAATPRLGAPGTPLGGRRP